MKIIEFFRSLRDDSRTYSRNSTHNNPTFQLPDRNQIVSRAQVPDETHFITPFPSIVDEDRLTSKSPAQPNTTIENSPTFQLQDRTPIVSRVKVPDKNNLVTSFPSKLNDKSFIIRPPAQPNTTSENSPTFQLQDRTRIVSRAQVPEKNHLVTSFLSNLNEKRFVIRSPAQPNTTTENSPTFQLQDRTRVVSRVTAPDETRLVTSLPSLQNTGLEMFYLLQYISSVSVSNALLKLILVLFL